MEIRIHTNPILEQNLIEVKNQNRLSTLKKSLIHVINDYFKLRKEVQNLKSDLLKKESELRYYNDLFNRIRDAKKAHSEIQRLTGYDLDESSRNISLD